MNGPGGDMAAPSRPAGGCGGFTLLELLIALTLVALILVQLFGGLRLASRAWDSVEQRTARNDELRLAAGFVRRALTQARKIDWPVEGRSYALFWGNPTQMEFVTPLSEYVGLGGLYLVRIARLDRGEGSDLVMQRWLLHPDILEGGSEIPPWHPLEPVPLDLEPGDLGEGAYGATVLASDVGEIGFDYFGVAQPRGDEAQWLAEWKEQNALPLVVRMGFGEAGEWPDILVPLVDG
jgi:general secretion pathway protein J